MTDKQIIDGVDVSGCEFFDSGNCVECDMRVHFYGDIPCDDECNRNCYYKQLKRKEQECEELKNRERCAWKSLEGSFCPEAQQKLDQLKAENEELKFQNKRFDEVALYWHKRIFKVERSERKLKQALTEIKEIALSAPVIDS